MPWKETNKVEERIKFIQKILCEGKNMSAVCREFGISRPTGYKFLDRFFKLGIIGLLDMSKSPGFHPNQTPKAIEKLVLELRKKTKDGPKKLKNMLERAYPGVQIPANSTISEIINRNGLEVKIRKRRRFPKPSTKLSESKQANDVWCVDFKGQFRLKNGKYCFPLTVTDHYSRFILGIESLENTKTIGVMHAFENIFQNHGLPKIIRSDNGSPFASCGLKGLSKLSAWWMRLGIEPERIEPGHPEQNGRHERMHLTLKQKTTRPAGNNFLHQQERFDRFRHEYNMQRPHEGIGMKRPKELYTNSKIKYPDSLDEPDYPLHDVVKRVNNAGCVKFKKYTKFYLSTSLSGELVGLREISPKIWLVSFMSSDLGYYDEKENKFYDTLEQLYANRPKLKKSEVEIIPNLYTRPIDYEVINYECKQ